MFSFMMDAKSQGSLAALQAKILQIKETIEFAKNCLPQLKEKEIEFCTGLKLNGITQLIKKSCVKSDKTPLTEKKKNALTCLRNLIYSKQIVNKEQQRLSPLQRKITFQKLETILLGYSEKVAQLNEKKKHQQMKILTDTIQEGIKYLKEYSDISHWLDQKELYFVLYKYCKKSNSCQANDWDSIVSNIFKLKDRFPWRFRNEIISSASKNVKNKEESYFDKVNFKPLVISDLNFVDKLMSMGWEELILLLNKKGIKLYQFKMREQVVKRKDANLIPIKILETFPEPNKKRLIELLNYSKINKGYVLGKFICSPKDRANYIIITNNTSKETLIHEYMHYLQSIKNPKYCDALTTQNNIALDFKTGKISREIYEQKIIKFKILIWKTEREVYSYMSNRTDLSPFEMINNKIQFIKFATKLTKSHKKMRTTEGLPHKLAFKVIDNLPRVKILNGVLILDLGAMDSVINPLLIFNKFKLREIQPIKMMTLQNALGKKFEAPFVTLKGKIKINNNNVDNSKWILSNLNLPQIDGVLGLNFFANKNLIIYPKLKYIEIRNHLMRPKNAFSLQQDYNKMTRSVEFICPKGLIVRLDSGSQVEGDFNKKLPMEVIASLRDRNEGYQCGNLQIKGEFTSELQNEGIFDRGVGLNIGWPYISKFKKISISLKDSWIHFSK